MLSSLSLFSSFSSLAPQKINEPVITTVKEKEIKTYYLVDKGSVTESEYNSRLEDLINELKNYNNHLSEFNSNKFIESLEGFFYCFDVNDNKTDLIINNQEIINKSFQNIFLYLQKVPEEELEFLNELYTSLYDFIRESHLMDSLDSSKISFVKTFEKEFMSFFERNKDQMNFENFLSYSRTIRTILNNRFTSIPTIEFDEQTFYKELINKTIIAFEKDKDKSIDVIINAHSWLNDFLDKHDDENNIIDTELALSLVSSFGRFYSQKLTEIQPYQKTKIILEIRESLKESNLTEENCNTIYESLGGADFLSALIKDYAQFNNDWRVYGNFSFLSKILFESDEAVFEKAINNLNFSEENLMCFYAVHDFRTSNKQVSEERIKLIYDKLIKKSIKTIKTDFSSLKEDKFFELHHHITYELDNYFKDDIESKKDLTMVLAETFSEVFGLSGKEKQNTKRRILNTIEDSLKNVNYSSEEKEEIRKILGQNLVEKLMEDYNQYISELNQEIENKIRLHSFYIYDNYLDLISFYSNLYESTENINELLFEDFKTIHKTIQKNPIIHSLLSRNSSLFLKNFNSDQLIDFFISELKQDLSNIYCYSELMDTLNEQVIRSKVSNEQNLLENVKKTINLVFSNEKEMKLREIDHQSIFKTINNLELQDRRELFSSMKKNYEIIPYQYLLPINTKKASDEFLEIFQEYAQSSEKHIIKFEMHIQELDSLRINFDNLIYLINGTNKLSQNPHSTVRNGAEKIREGLISLIPISIGYPSNEELEEIISQSIDAKVYLPVIDYCKERLNALDQEVVESAVQKLKEDTFLENIDKLTLFFDEIKHFSDKIIIREYRTIYYNPEVLVSYAEKVERFFSTFDSAYTEILKELIDHIAETNTVESKNLLQEISQDNNELENIRNHAKSKLNE